MTPAPHVVVCPFIDPGGAGTVQNSYRILDLFRGSARARCPALSLSMDLRDLVRQSTRARQKLALLWLASRGAHIPKFLPPPSHAGRRSTPSPRLPVSPPHEFAGRPAESPELYREPSHGAGVLVLT